MVDINTNRIEIDLTHDCDRGCSNCDRLCRQAPEPFLLEMASLEKFVADSNRLGRKWSSITVGGGDISKHPVFGEALCILSRSSCTTNGDRSLHTYVAGHLSDDTNRAIPGDIIRYLNRNHFPEDHETYRVNDVAIPVLMSPTDLGTFHIGCVACRRPATHGMCLNRNGFFACAVGGAIDRVLGWGLGIKDLEQATQEALSVRGELLCAHCGGYLSSWGYILDALAAGETATITWKRAMASRKQSLNKLYDNPFPISMTKVELEITLACNMSCHNCSRCCQLTTKGESMSLDDVRRFADETRDAKWPWGTISISGGEPTLHPEFKAIVEEIERLREDVPGVKLQFFTNRFEEHGRQLVDDAVKHGGWEVCGGDCGLPRTSYNAFHAPTCVSPHELGAYSGVRYCEHPMFDGLVLNNRGYSLCTYGSTINRIFNLGIAIARLEDVTYDRLREQAESVCRNCGEYLRQVGFFHPLRASETMIDSLWSKKIDEYNSRRP